VNAGCTSPVLCRSHGDKGSAPRAPRLLDTQLGEYQHSDDRGAERDPEFDTGVLLPGRSYAPLRYERGFFFNDLPFPQDTDKIIVY
jgi:hypothetical protein